MNKLLYRTLCAIPLLLSTHTFSQSVKEQYNNAIQAESSQKNYAMDRLEMNYRNSKIYVCSSDYYQNKYLIIIGNRILYVGQYSDERDKSDHTLLKKNINYFDRDSSVYTKSGGELSWNSEDFRYTFDSPALTLYANRLSSRSLEKHGCFLFKDVNRQTNQTTAPSTKPPQTNQNQPTINRPTELEKTLLSPMKF